MKADTDTYFPAEVNVCYKHLKNLLGVAINISQFLRAKLNAIR